MKFDENNITDIRAFANTAIIIIVNILRVNIIIPRIVEDAENPNTDCGYYMYKSADNLRIILNINEIEALKDPDDMKTVITYGFIHEIFHMFQNINSNYFSDAKYHNMIEDGTDYDTIDFIRDNIDLIQNKLNFKFNEVFLKGIERQLEWKIAYKNYYFNYHNYLCNTITGLICNKININYDFIRKLLDNFNYLKIIYSGHEIIINLIDYDVNSIAELLLLFGVGDSNTTKFIHFEYCNELNEVIFKIY